MPNVVAPLHEYHLRPRWALSLLPPVGGLPGVPNLPFGMRFLDGLVGLFVSLMEGKFF